MSNYDTVKQETLKTGKLKKANVGTVTFKEKVCKAYKNTQTGWFGQGKEYIGGRANG